MILSMAASEITGNTCRTTSRWPEFWATAITSSGGFIMVDGQGVDKATDADTIGEDADGVDIESQAPWRLGNLISAAWLYK